MKGCPQFRLYFVIVWSVLIHDCEGLGGPVARWKSCGVESTRVMVVLVLTHPVCCLGGWAWFTSSSFSLLFVARNPDFLGHPIFKMLATN